MAKTSRPKRIVVISDLHCGHRAGLTPPAWQWSDDPGEFDGRSAESRAWFGKLQRINWDWYVKKMRALQPIDGLVVNGDAVDGAKHPTECIHADPNDQVDMAEQCIRVVKFKKLLIIRGTPYHTGQFSDVEDRIAERFSGCALGDHDQVTVNGLCIDFKHKTGGGKRPHTTGGGPRAERFDLDMYHKAGRMPLVHVVVRSHTHQKFYHPYELGDTKFAEIITPSLQCYGSKYGSRQCSGFVDFGIGYFDVYDKGNWEWHVKLLNHELMKSKVLTW